MLRNKDREVEKALNKHSEGAGWLSKGTDLFSQCSLPAKLLQQVLHLQITYNPLAFLMTHNRMWALAPYSVSDQKVKGFLKRSVMFLVVLGSFYIRISSQDVLLSSTAWHDSFSVLSTGFQKAKFTSSFEHSFCTANDEILLFSAASRM